MDKKYDPELEGKSFFQKWKIGLKRISAEQMVQAKISSHYGAMLGIAIVSTTFLYQIDYINFFSVESLRSVGLAIFMLCLGGLQIVEVVKGYKQIEEMKKEKEIYLGVDLNDKMS